MNNIMVSRASHEFLSDESLRAPQAQIARFGDWRYIPNFEMAYIPGNNDYLYWSLGPNYKVGPYAAPFSGPDGNGIDGRLYGTNDIPIRNMVPCEPYVNSCLPKPFVHTRAPGQPIYY